MILAIEVNSTNIVCTKCGTSYGRRKGYFAVNYGVLYKGIGHLPICKTCVDEIYNNYLSQCEDSKSAVRQVCRKLDVYWNEKLFDAVEKKATTRTTMTSYLAKVTSITYAGKSYDDTLLEEGTLWKYAQINNEAEIKEEEPIEVDEQKDEELEKINSLDENIKAYWGKGFSYDDYIELEQKRERWLSSFPKETNISVSMESHIKQICLLDLDMDKARAKGATVSDKMLKAYTDLLGSANLKPVQKQKEENDSAFDNTPMGVWLYRFENKRPLPDNHKDSQLLKYVFTWMGHVLKMLGVKNGYEELYQSEIDRLRVEKPEYDGDDEELMIDYMNDGITDINNGDSKDDC